MRRVQCLIISQGSRILNTTVQVLKRDGYQCVVTGLRDISHPLFHRSQNQIKTNASHIFRRAIAAYDAHDPDSRTVRLQVVSSGSSLINSCGYIV
jgi:hypothetical protein